jgi:hypothetical protein
MFKMFFMADYIFASNFVSDFHLNKKSLWGKPDSLFRHSTTRKRYPPEALILWFFYIAPLG